MGGRFRVGSPRTTTWRTSNRPSTLNVRSVAPLQGYHEQQVIRNPLRRHDRRPQSAERLRGGATLAINSRYGLFELPPPGGWAGREWSHGRLRASHVLVGRDDWHWWDRWDVRDKTICILIRWWPRVGVTERFLGI
jgi:hypothetical protein